ncbi:MAG TPA: helix-hairpin-helix domain-containing protein [Draconibacterium sp.]|nr:helix-hairpin-helix domain-containing protein [Draconibacterium sp.]
MNIFSGWFKNYNHFSKSDRNAIIILCACIILTTISIIIVSNIQPKSEYNYFEYNLQLDEIESPEKNDRFIVKSLFPFNPNTINSKKLDSLDLPQFVKQNILNYRKAGGRFSSKIEVRKIYGMNDSIFNVIKDYIEITDKNESLSENTKAFNKKEEIKNAIKGKLDPNNADYNQLISFGFNSFQAKNITEYRKKGGAFKIKTDLLKIYGIDSAFYNSIEKVITIEVDDKKQVLENYPVLLHVELNSADSTELMKLKGIGAVYANRVIKYRNLLGGFYSTSQLLEVYNFPSETFKSIENSIYVDTLLVKKIRLNFADYPELLRHPYLNKDQVTAILKYRNQNGSFQDIFQLKTTGLVDPESFSRIRPYLTCR